MERPLAVLAILIGVVALSVIVVGAKEAERRREELGAPAGVEGLSYHMRSVERSCTQVTAVLKEVTAKVGKLEATLAGVRKPPVMEKESLGRLCDEALKKRDLTPEGETGEPKKGEGVKKGEAKAAVAKEPAAKPRSVLDLPEGKDRTGVGKLREKWRAELVKAGLSAENAAKAAEMLEAERQKTMEIIRKHRGDREGYGKARAELAARTDKEVAARIGPQDFKKFAKWRGSPERFLKREGDVK